MLRISGMTVPLIIPGNTAVIPGNTAVIPGLTRNPSFSFRKTI